MRRLFIWFLFFGVVSLESNERQKEDSICVIFVCDKNDTVRFRHTYEQLRRYGRYQGDVCLIATGGLCAKDVPFFSGKNCHVVSFDQIELPSIIFKTAIKPRAIEAQIQKFHIFQAYFKEWDFLLYLDCGMQIHKNIDVILQGRKKGAYLAPGDLNIKGHIPAKIACQFKDLGDGSYQKILNEFDMTKLFPRSGIALYDSSIIQEDSVDTLVTLLNTYPYGWGDQGYIALYVIFLNPVWEPLVREDKNGYYYDFCPRTDKEVYVMHKYHCLPLKCPKCSAGSARLKF
ncbi:hypothetical protein K0U07_05630 [bacterium]|nr:hypothetical protein [bacterium]